MKTNKRTYQAPHVNCVELDNEISLILASSPAPMDDPESWTMSLTNAETIISNPLNFDNA